MATNFHQLRLQLGASLTNGNELALGLIRTVPIRGVRFKRLLSFLRERDLKQWLE